MPDSLAQDQNQSTTPVIPTFRMFSPRRAVLFKMRPPDLENVSGNKTFILNEHRVHRAVFFFFYYYCLLCFIFFLARKKAKLGWWPS